MSHNRRYILSLEFLMRFMPKGAYILDLGQPNTLSKIMESYGYFVLNTGKGEDLDYGLKKYESFPDCVTAFEILEHLVNPFQVLRDLPAKRLIASVPLRLWFAKAYDNGGDDRHFHEFEKWQFDWLLEKAGWKIVASETHRSPSYKPAVRSLLRCIYPRWYFVYAVKNN